MGHDFSGWDRSGISGNVVFHPKAWWQLDIVCHGAIQLTRNGGSEGRRSKVAKILFLLRISNLASFSINLRKPTSIDGIECGLLFTFALVTYFLPLSSIPIVVFTSCALPILSVAQLSNLGVLPI